MNKIKIRVHNIFIRDGKKREIVIVLKKRKKNCDTKTAKPKTVRPGKKYKKTIKNGESITIYPNVSPHEYPDFYKVEYSPKFFEFDKNVIFTSYQGYPIPEVIDINGGKKKLRIKGKRSPWWYVEIKHPVECSKTDKITISPESGNVTVGDDDQ